MLYQLSYYGSEAREGRKPVSSGKEQGRRSAPSAEKAQVGHPEGQVTAGLVDEDRIEAPTEVGQRALAQMDAVAAEPERPDGREGCTDRRSAVAASARRSI